MIEMLNLLNEEVECTVYYMMRDGKKLEIPGRVYDGYSDLVHACKDLGREGMGIGRMTDIEVVNDCIKRATNYLTALETVLNTDLQSDVRLMLNDCGVIVSSWIKLIQRDYNLV